MPRQLTAHGWVNSMETAQNRWHSGMQREASRLALVGVRTQ
jgi:hypothetical protein